ncbi:hypothetical protein NEPAR08_2469, partial [Nematocida parisii]
REKEKKRKYLYREVNGKECVRRVPRRAEGAHRADTRRRTGPGHLERRRGAQRVQGGWAAQRPPRRKRVPARPGEAQHRRRSQMQRSVCASRARVRAGRRPAGRTAGTAQRNREKKKKAKKSENGQNTRRRRESAQTPAESPRMRPACPAGATSHAPHALQHALRHALQHALRHALGQRRKRKREGPCGAQCRTGERG